jgi:hypothetical protein
MDDTHRKALIHATTIVSTQSDLDRVIPHILEAISEAISRDIKGTLCEMIAELPESPDVIILAQMKLLKDDPAQEQAYMKLARENPHLWMLCE